MKRFAALLFILSTATPAFAQQTGDQEIICDGFKFREAAGIMYIDGEVKNNTPFPIKNFKVRIQYLRGTKIVHESLISCEDFDPREQRKISARTESLPVRWTDYRMSFFEGTTPLTWRVPRR